MMRSTPYNLGVHFQQLGTKMIDLTSIHIFLVATKLGDEWCVRCMTAHHSTTSLSAPFTRCFNFRVTPLCGAHFQRESRGSQNFHPLGVPETLLFPQRVKTPTSKVSRDLTRPQRQHVQGAACGKTQAVRNTTTSFDQITLTNFSSFQNVI